MRFESTAQLGQSAESDPTIAFQSQPYFDIDAYAVIGDLHTVALVGPAGCIDWCCLPVFDSASVFARILDSKIGGMFSVAPASCKESSMRYLFGTNILMSTLTGDNGEIELLDYMPMLRPDGGRPNEDTGYICRHVECVSGVHVEVIVRFDPRPQYGLELPELDYHDNGAATADGKFRLSSSHRIIWDEDSRIGRIRLSKGDSARLVFHSGDAHLPRDLVAWTDRSFYETRRYWENWLDQCLYRGRWRRMVERSALTLKLMTFKPTGAIVAAPTASLPEEIGGERNWDYRFCWPRDSALTLSALYLLGFSQEADAYVEWLITKRPAVGEPMPTLYSIGAVDNTSERTLDHLEGYRGSGPVRIGNGACDQLQLDVYGEMIDSLYLHSIHSDRLDARTWMYICQLADRICNEWQLADEGIWEVRGGSQHFTYSKLMCWTGLDRAIRIARDNALDCDLEKWQTQMQAIRDYLENECVDSELEYFTQSPTAREADASNLLIPLMAFLPTDDARVLNTLDQTIEQLSHDGMVFRYRSEDGLDGEEGAFNICTFWLVEALAACGRVEEAAEIFNRMLSLANSLGLYSEETEPRAQVALGNFPQAFSHIGLINAALTLDRRFNGKTAKEN